MTLSISTLYGEWPTTDADFHALLDDLPGPRAPSSFFDRLRPLNLNETSEVLDIGCRDGASAREIHRAFGARVIGVDPIVRHLDRANARMKRLVAAGALRFQEGTMASIPCDDASIDALCCRDVLMHVPNLDAGFDECRRVARSGATMLLGAVLATPLLADAEARPLYAALAVQPASMSRTNIEAAATKSGWRIDDHEAVGTHWQEAKALRTSVAHLSVISRMLRERERLVEQLGALHYEVELQHARWGVFQMLGKLEPHVWQLTASP